MDGDPAEHAAAVLREWRVADRLAVLQALDPELLRETLRTLDQYDPEVVVELLAEAVESRAQAPADRAAVRPLRTRRRPA